MNNQKLIETTPPKTPNYSNIHIFSTPSSEAPKEDFRKLVYFMDDLGVAEAGSVPFGDFEVFENSNNHLIGLNELSDSLRDVREQKTPTEHKFIYHQPARRVGKKSQAFTKMLMDSVYEYYKINKYNPEVIELTENQFRLLGYEFDNRYNKTTINHAHPLEHNNDKLEFMGITLKIIHPRTLRILESR